ncbi:MAG: sulfite exporter TauE/SafE family protein [Bacteroidetes bacterium]|nr:sulfite exporter TauE/SafE family protein [Bacteroidota bacterium]
MDFVVICSVSLAASLLTLFSGFGLGTLLLPAFLLFFPVDIAVAMTAVVHFLNSIFKLLLLGKHADRRVVVRFGVPAITASFLGAIVLVHAAGLPPVGGYSLFGSTYQVLPVHLLMGVLIVVFAILEGVPLLHTTTLSGQHLIVGGLMSGFFGGLSGHQGALRSAFLIRVGLSKEAFIATGVVIACLVDITRLGVYVQRYTVDGLGSHIGLLLAAVGSAYLGAYVGSRLMKKVTMRSIQKIVAVLLVLVGVGLALGLL